jgi:di/tricarboxylate transporter
LVPAREFYTQIDWPVVVMLACLLPLGEAVDSLGGTALAAGLMLDLTHGWPPVVALVLLMIATMALTNVLNNVATMVIAGPLALAMAHALGVNPDTFLMGATVATSCAFLTPIGHQNNALIMGPGGYAFADYWRLGLALEAVVLAAGVPMLLLVWPL